MGNNAVQPQTPQPTDTRRVSVAHVRRSHEMPIALVGHTVTILKGAYPENFGGIVTEAGWALALKEVEQVLDSADPRAQRALFRLKLLDWGSYLGASIGFIAGCLLVFLGFSRSKLAPGLIGLLLTLLVPICVLVLVTSPSRARRMRSRWAKAAVSLLTAALPTIARVCFGNLLDLELTAINTGAGTFRLRASLPTPVVGVPVQAIQEPPDIIAASADVGAPLMPAFAGAAVAVVPVQTLSLSGRVVSVEGVPV